MRNILFVMLMILVSVQSWSKQDSLKVTWFGATCLLLEDGENSILFDPFFTRPSLWEVVSFKSLRSDPKVIERWLPEEKIESISALIISHSHYDHTLDLVNIAKKSGARVYGSKSTRNIALGGGVPRGQIELIKNRKVFNVGKFKIEVLKGDHPAHFFGVTLVSGEIDQPLKPGAAAYSYKKGEDYSFLIHHPKGNILLHPSGNSVLEKEDTDAFEAEIVILGVANRRSSLSLLEKVVLPSKGKVLIPVHFDNIFSPLSKPLKHLRGVQMGEFYRVSRDTLSGVRVKTLDFGEIFSLPH